MAEYIKCEKAVEILKQKSLKMFNNYYKGYMQAIKDLIDECPAADVEPVRRGHWVWEANYRDYDGDISSVHSCSVCGAKNDETTNYCPNCGARMDARMGGE